MRIAVNDTAGQMPSNSIGGFAQLVTPPPQPLGDLLQRFPDLIRPAAKIASIMLIEVVDSSETLTRLGHRVPARQRHPGILDGVDGTQWTGQVDRCPDPIGRLRQQCPHRRRPAIDADHLVDPRGRCPGGDPHHHTGTVEPVDRVHGVLDQLGTRRIESTDVRHLLREPAGTRAPGVRRDHSQQIHRRGLGST
jgi:hypothetical protein